MNAHTHRIKDYYYLKEGNNKMDDDDDGCLRCESLKINWPRIVCDVENVFAKNDKIYNMSIESMIPLFIIKCSLYIDDV